MNQFRVANPADAMRLVELIRSAYRGEVSRQGWASEADLVGGERIDVDQVLKIIDEPNSMMLVLDGEQDIIACCQLTDLRDGLAHFGTFAVHPSAQGVGLGRRLMAEAERHALTFGANMIEITVLAQQETLISWYERLGFRGTGEKRPFPVDPRFARPLRDDLYFVVLAKTLPCRQID
jgi:ribosomal protein S18 acetylase RimI-like enzyme